MTAKPRAPFHNLSAPGRPDSVGQYTNLPPAAQHIRVEYFRLRRGPTPLGREPTGAATSHNQELVARTSRIWHRNHDLFLAQKIEVGVAAGARIDDRRKIPRKRIRTTAPIIQGKGKGNLQRDLGRPDGFAVFPKLTVNGDLTARTNGIQERPAIARKFCAESYHAGKQ